MGGGNLPLRSQFSIVSVLTPSRSASSSFESHLRSWSRCPGRLSRLEIRVLWRFFGWAWVATVTVLLIHVRGSRNKQFIFVFMTYNHQRNHQPARDLYHGDIWWQEKSPTSPYDGV